MNAAKSSSADTPVYKAGGVILRGLDGDAPEVLITQPRPKPETPHDIPSMGLPRGTRKYWKRDGTLGKTWYDARNAETALANAKNLEPLTSTLQSEVHEEAGMRPEWLRQQPVFELGTKEFKSSTKAPYLVQWYVIMPNEATQKKMEKEPLKDAEKTQWVSVPELKRRTMLTRGKQDCVNPAYVPIVEEAIAQMKANALPRVTSIPPLP
jgi:hypothetical protein